MSGQRDDQTRPDRLIKEGSSPRQHQSASSMIVPRDIVTLIISPDHA